MHVNDILSYTHIGFKLKIKCVSGLDPTDRGEAVSASRLKRTYLYLQRNRKRIFVTDTCKNGGAAITNLYARYHSFTMNRSYYSKNYCRFKKYFIYILFKSLKNNIFLKNIYIFTIFYHIFMQKN